MDHRIAAQEALQAVGGRDNVVSAAHCATRLRLVIADNGKLDKAKLEACQGVRGVMLAPGQVQIVYGTGVVNRVYHEFAKLADVPEDTEAAPVRPVRANPLLRAVTALSDVFVPILPVIVASGLLMGITEGLDVILGGALQANQWWGLVHSLGGVSLAFMQILVGFSAARVFGGNEYLGSIVGMAMLSQQGLQGHIVPVVIAVFVLCTLERWLHRHVPDVLDFFVTPLVSVLVAGILALVVIGPLVSVVENLVMLGFLRLLELPLGVGGAIVGAVYPLTVVLGIHHTFGVVEANLLASGGANGINPIISCCNIAQGAACLAVFARTRNKARRDLALPAGFSGLIGITEPAIFGVNLPNLRPFVAAVIGGAVGGAVSSALGVTSVAFEVTGLFGLFVTVGHTAHFALSILASAVVAFAVGWALYKEPAPEAEAPGEKNPDAKTPVPNAPAAAAKAVVGAPMSGRLLSLDDIPDKAFAARMLGDGFAIDPADGKVVAPLDGTVVALLSSKHAIGIIGDNGAEVLVHVGIDTVTLDGGPFEAHVAQGDRVRAGQLLVEADLDAIRAAGLSPVTPVVITNGDDYEVFELANGPDINAGETVLTLR